MALFPNADSTEVEIKKDEIDEESYYEFTNGLEDLVSPFQYSIYLASLCSSPNIRELHLRDCDWYSKVFPLPLGQPKRCIKRLPIETLFRKEKQLKLSTPPTKLKSLSGKQKYPSAKSLRLKNKYIL